METSIAEGANRGGMEFVKRGAQRRFDYPALVAGWGQRYYRAELAAIRELMQRLHRHAEGPRAD